MGRQCSASVTCGKNKTRTKKDDMRTVYFPRCSRSLTLKLEKYCSSSVGPNQFVAEVNKTEKYNKRTVSHGAQTQIKLQIKSF